LGLWGLQINGGLHDRTARQTFFSAPTAVCLWFLSKKKNDGKRRDRRKQTLFNDARNMGTLIDRVRRELTDADLKRIVSTFHAWRGIMNSRGVAEYAEKIFLFLNPSTPAHLSARQFHAA